MISKTNTLKLIKEKIDARKSGKAKVKKPFFVEFKEGTFRHTEHRRVTALIKQGNSVMWKDDAYQLRNINILEAKDLHKLMWGLISDKEKMQIAIEHLRETKPYLED